MENYAISVTFAEKEERELFKKWLLSSAAARSFDQFLNEADSEVVVGKNFVPKNGLIARIFSSLD